MSTMIVTERKKLKKRAQRRFPGYCMAWVGGQLCFTGDVPASVGCQVISRAVPGVPCVPEYGRKSPPGAGQESFQQTRASKPSPLKANLAVYYNYNELPRARHQDGECRKCMNFPNPDKKKVQTPKGEVRDLITCSRCGLEMRPFSL